MRIPNIIRGQYNSDNGEIRAAIADAITATAFSIGMTLAYFQAVNFFGAHYPVGTREVLGFIGIKDYMRWENLGMVAVIALATFIVSMLAIIITSFAKRPMARTGRSGKLTTIAVIVAMASTTTVGLLIVQKISISSVLESLLAFGFVAIPAALRLTSPNAFGYRYVTA